MRRSVYLGVDIGTSSSKGVLVDTAGRILRIAAREHAVERPHPGHVEMDGALWWQEFVEIASELTAPGDIDVVSVGVSGMGPCVLLADIDGTPLRPAILYGVDTRAVAQIDRLDDELGHEQILARGGSVLSSQAVGPKLAWLRENEPEIYSRARHLFMPASWLVYRLTGEYVLDHHSASQCTPLYDIDAMDWYGPWVELVAPGLPLPAPRWAGDRAGVTSAEIAGIPAGTPVTVGTIDAWSEAVSVGADRTGDLMLMYGTTLFLVATTAQRVTSELMWGTVGVAPGSRCLAGGMATSGAITAWLRDLTESGYPALLADAVRSGPGARGLLMLPYFAGERTPIFDPSARGVIAGLTVSHARGDVYRAALEATAFGVRHNVDAMRRGGAGIERVVAAGGGTQGELWPQIVTDITGLEQVIPSNTIGASYGAAYLAARLVNDVDIAEWNPPARVLRPNPALQQLYETLYGQYLRLYPATKEVVHTLSRIQEDMAT